MDPFQQPVSSKHRTMDITLPNHSGLFNTVSTVQSPYFQIDSHVYNLQYKQFNTYRHCSVCKCTCIWYIHVT